MTEAFHLVVVKGPSPGLQITVPPGGISVGRSSRSGVTILDPSISRHHCRLMFRTGDLWVVDSGSANATLVNGKDIQECPLQTGDRLELGNTIMEVRNNRLLPVGATAAITGLFRRAWPWLAGTAILFAIVAAFLHIRAPRDRTAQAMLTPLESPVPAHVEIAYERVTADSNGVRRVVMHLTPAGVLHIATEDHGSMFTRRESTVPPYVLTELAHAAEESDFYSIEEEYAAAPALPASIQTLLVRVGPLSQRTTVRNAMPPLPFSRLVKRLDALAELPSSSSSELAAPDELLPHGTGIVLLRSNPAGASTSVNGKDIGPTPLLVDTMALGRHRVRFSLPGYVTTERSIEVTNRRPAALDVRLTRASAVLDVFSRPARANVLVNGVAVGVTPCSIPDIRPESISVHIALRGYAPWEETIDVTPGVTNSVQAVLTILPARLTVVSSPPHAAVYLEDDPQGNTPLTVTNLPAGETRLRIALDRFEPVERTVQLQPGVESIEQVTLTSNVGNLVVTTEPADVSVFVDGKPVGLTLPPDGASDRTEGTLTVSLPAAAMLTVELRKSGYETHSYSADVVKGETRHILAQLRKAFVPDYQVETADGIQRGMLVEVTAEGDVRLQDDRGIVRTFKVEDIVAGSPLISTEPRSPLPPQ